MRGILLITADKTLSAEINAALQETPARIVAECASERLAVDTYAKAPGALVVADMFLPESSGVEVLKSLKRINESGMFLILTRIRTRTMIERAFRMGAQDVIVYPVNKDVLRDTILHRLNAQPSPESSDESESEIPAPKPARKK